MAAEAAISFAVQTLGDALIQKAVSLKGVEKNVQWLKDELDSMQAFLKDAYEKQAKNESIRKWISDIREVAYDAEDAIEKFVLKVDTPKRSRGLVSKCACLPTHLYNLHVVGDEIESIRERLKDIDQRRERYQINKNKDQTSDDVAESSTRRSLENIERMRRFAPLEKNKQLVGLNAKVNMLLENSILENSHGLSLAAIFGMGGIGKSTLARAIYDHPEVVARFDCRAWVVASNEFTPQGTIKQLLLELKEDKLTEAETLKKMEDSAQNNLHFEQMLHERLRQLLEGKRFFIVVDDLWEETHWASLRNAFPDEKDKASRLLFTSRNSIISKHEGYVHDMKLLDDDESLELLLKTAFIGNIPQHVESELEKIGRAILKKCGGLPLAITIAGGLLMKKGGSVSGWENVLKEMKSVLDRNDGRESSSALPILELSYFNLPTKLKACFMCLGFFKEDAAIRTKRLVHIWVAQGIVPQDEEKTMEEVAEGYLDDLLNRNLVQIKDLSEEDDDEEKTCHIHDLIRDLSIKKAKEEINFEIVENERNIHQSPSHKPRHRAVYCSKGESFISSNADRNKHIRSLFVHERVNAFGPSSYWKSFELLRILDFEDCRLRKLPDAIGELIGLRYLGLRETRVDKLPSSLGNLINLEVLDLRNGYEIKTSNIIWKMRSLRHLFSSQLVCINGWKSLKISSLRNIETLEGIELTDSNVEGLTELTNLRTLSIWIRSRLSDESKLFSILSKLQNLVHLSIRKHFYSEGPINIDGLSSLQRLSKLVLDGRITGVLNSASNFPPNLSHLTLKWTTLDEDPMPILEKLPKLVRLDLLFEAYNGEVMVISHDGFPNLKTLRLFRLKRLRNIEIRKGALPELQILHIEGCGMPKSFKEEVTQVLPNLKRMYYYNIKI